MRRSTSTLGLLLPSCDEVFEGSSSSTYAFGVRPRRGLWYFLLARQDSHRGAQTLVAECVLPQHHL
jgi:hypothetical protein